MDKTAGTISNNKSKDDLNYAQMVYGLTSGLHLSLKEITWEMSIQQVILLSNASKKAMETNKEETYDFSKMNPEESEAVLKQFGLV